MNQKIYREQNFTKNRNIGVHADPKQKENALSILSERGEYEWHDIFGLFYKTKIEDIMFKLYKELSYFSLQFNFYIYIYITYFEAKKETSMFLQLLQDGTSHYMKGVVLCLAYCAIAACFFFHKLPISKSF